MMINYVRSDQQENKSSVLPHFLFYRNVSLSLIVHICILAIYSRFIGCLPLEKSQFYHSFYHSGIIVAHYYRKGP
jgi:hypothetical protein